MFKKLSHAHTHKKEKKLEGRSWNIKKIAVQVIKSNNLWKNHLDIHNTYNTHKKHKHTCTRTHTHTQMCLLCRKLSSWQEVNEHKIRLLPTPMKLKKWSNKKSQKLLHAHNVQIKHTEEGRNNKYLHLTTTQRGSFFSKLP